MANYIDREAAVMLLNVIMLSVSPDERTAKEDRPVAAGRCMGLSDAISAVGSFHEADVVPWSFLERYADWFCAVVSMPEFVREAKDFYLSTTRAMESGGIVPEEEKTEGPV